MSISSSNGGGGRGRHEADVPGTVASIPLSDVDVEMPGTSSIGNLVKDATAQVSTLVRAEVELAKAEVTGEVKKGLQGSLFFILALTVLLFSAFFFFFFLAELLDMWLPRWLAFLIVFLLMLVVAARAGVDRLPAGTQAARAGEDHRLAQAGQDRVALDARRAEVRPSGGALGR